MRGVFVRGAMAVLLGVAVVATTPAVAPARDADAEFVESFRAEQLRFGRGGKALVLVEQYWRMDQVLWPGAHSTPVWGACILVWYRNGSGEEGCSGPRIRSASVDPLLRSADYSFSMQLPAEQPWQVELHTRERAASRSTQRVAPRRWVERAGPSVRFNAEGVVWRRDSRPQITRGLIRTPSGRLLKLRTVDDQGGRLARFVRGSAETGWSTIWGPDVDVPPQPPEPTLPPPPPPTLPAPLPCIPTCPPPGRF